MAYDKEAMRKKNRPYAAQRGLRKLERSLQKRRSGKPLPSRRAEIRVSPDGCSRYRANERQRNRCKQGGTVEYELYPTPESSGAGFLRPELR